MSDSNKPNDERIRDLIVQYISNRIELLKLESADISARVFSLFLIYFVLLFVLFIALIMLSILGGIYISSLLHSHIIGFSIVSGIYLILFLIMYLRRNTIAEKYLANQFIKSFFKETHGNKS